MTSFEYIRERCGNKEWGGRIIYHNYKLCFQPLKFEQADDGRWYYSDHIEEADLIIVARGIVPHYIRYEHEKDLKELFADYFNGCFETFKNNRRNDIELMLKSEKDIEIAFVETMIDEESGRIDFSKKGLKQYAEYFTNEENEILRQVCNGFMGYLQDRLKDLKPTQEQPTTPTNTPSAKDKGKDKPTKSIIDTDKLQTLFMDSFFAKDYNIQDTHNKSLKLSRYDKLCQRLEMILTDTDKKPDQQTIGAIAYMIYCSPYTKAEYRKPKREGTKGGFANLIRIFFDIVGKDHPSDTRPNKYKKPIEDMVLYFGDILKWE